MPTPAEDVPKLLATDRELLALLSPTNAITAWGPDKDVPRVSLEGLSFHDASETERQRYWSSLRRLLGLGIVQGDDDSKKTKRRFDLSEWGAKVKEAMGSQAP